MNLTLNSQALAVELRILRKVVPSKPSIAVLGYVLLQADERLTLYATDLEVGLLTHAPATVHAPGRVALPAAHLLELVEQFPDGDVSFALDGKHLKVKCGAFSSRLQAYPADDFPAMPDRAGDVSTLNLAAFQQLITRTRYAVNASNAKHVLQGTLLKMQGPAAAMVGTDGKRLALATMAKEGADAEVIVPAKVLDRVLEQSGGQVEVTVGKHVFFAFGERLLFSRVFDGKFPSYERGIPTANDKTATVNKLALAAALRRVRLASAETRAVYLNLAENQIRLSSSSAELGDAEEDVQAVYAGEALRPCLNGDFLLDFLEAASAPSISMSFKDALSPVLLTDGVDHVGVIMPLRS